METIIRFIRNFAHLDNATHSPSQQTTLLEIEGSFIIINPTLQEVLEADKCLSVNDLSHSMNQSDYAGFGASIRAMS